MSQEVAFLFLPISGDMRFVPVVVRTVMSMGSFLSV